MAADAPRTDLTPRRIDTGRIAFTVRAAGQGPLMLFFHGITANSATLAPLAARFADRFTVVAIDQRGHGQSDKPKHGYQADDYADDIAALIAALDRGPAILVGHSLGSRNSVVAAAKHPGLVRSVVAIDFTPYIEPEVFDVLTARVNGGAQTFESLAAVEAYLAARYPNIPAPAIRIRAESGYEAAEGGLRPRAATHAMAETAEGLRADLTEAYRALARPTLIMRGAESKLVSAEALARTSALRPDLPVVVVPGADHYVNEVAPDITARAIANFIEA